MKTQQTGIKTAISLLFVGAVCVASAAVADTTLVYELTDAQGNKSEQRYQIHNRFMRIDRAVGLQPNALILDAGYMFMYMIDTDKKTFATFGSSPYHQGARVPAADKTGETADTAPKNPEKTSAAPSRSSVIKPTGKREAVEGIRCMVVNETSNDKPVAEHCLADSGALGMTPRELITMARLIEFSKQRTDPNWIAIQSDEDFVTIRSTLPDGETTFVLKQVSHDILPPENFRVPEGYKKVAPQPDYAGLITGSK